MTLQMHGVCQTFGDVVALHQVDFRADSGAIHAIVGENGAGKSTLMRVLYGAAQPDEGTIELDGREISFQSSAEAISAGIGMVSQHYSIIPELSCLQNLMLGAEGSWLIDHAKAEARASGLAQQMGYSFDWKDPAETLSPAGKQKLEILKLLWREAKVMILDEPTAMLSPADSDSLFASLGQLAAEGATVIVVTHRLPEVLDHCKTVSVLRSGKNVATKDVSETNSSELAELIVGRQIAVPKLELFEASTAILELADLTVEGYRGDDAVSGASLKICSGEVVGIAGVDGNGQRELFQSIIGRTRPSSGEIRFEGRSWLGSGPTKRIKDGLRLIPEDRHAEGVIDEWSLEENSSLGLQRLAPFAKSIWVDVQAREKVALQIADRFKTKHGGLKNAIKSLSGGNQQRFVAARALECSPRVILAFQPTRGLDIDGTAQVYSAIRETCRQGACALIVSFDLDELLENCDRVVAMNHGQVIEPPAELTKDRTTIGRLMVGAN